MDHSKTLIETTGYIKKEQRLKTIENNIIQNSFVLESSHPFQDYHGTDLPKKSRPNSLFLILSKETSFEDIARITKKIKQDFEYDFHASLGDIYFKTTSYSCIRIKYLKSFTFLPQLQSLYQENGIKFAKQKDVNADGLIVIHKHFYVDEIESGIYHDQEEDSKFYIELPKQISWTVFKDFTLNIKNNIDNSNFDAAQGVFYRKNGIIDVVRLYICEGQTDAIKTIQKLYVDLINKAHL